MMKRMNQVVTQVLIIWKGVPLAEATWEFLDELTLQFPSFTLEDKGVLMGEALSRTPIDQEQLLGESEKGSNGMANDRI